MKLLYVTSIDGDYGALSFQQSELGKKPYKEIYDFVKSEHDECYYDEENDFEITTYEFKGVVMTEEFESFLNDLKDYDVTKNTDWFIVDYENEEN